MPTPTLQTQLILETLRRDNRISPADFEEATSTLQSGGDPLDALLKADLLTKGDIDAAYYQYRNAPYADLDKIEVDADFSSLFGLELLSEHAFLPLYRFNDGLWLIGAVNPEDVALNQLLRACLPGSYQILSVDADKLDAYLKVYGASEATKSALRSIQNDDNAEIIKGKDASSDVANAPAVRFIDSTLEEAVKIGASDIHVEPSEKKVNVRYRIDGDLHEQATFDISFFPAISTRIKILSGIDIAEKRIPQDGHISKVIDGEKCDFRVSTLPTIHGEKFVIRVLDKKIFSMSLEELRFSKDVNETIQKILHHAHGIILLTGPTGSGKTTTLYSFLRELNKPSVNIVTIEDPVEYSMESINQIQINNKADLTFASALRSILRQDPDIIMVGEIRDEETAQIAIRAAITGHLVLSTLHTNDAPGAVTRLIDMGAASYLVSDALVAVISQRLLKRLCPHCKKQVLTTPEQRHGLGLKEDAMIYEPNGCPYCNNTGYRGRLAVHEIMYLNDELRSVINQPDVTMEEIREAAIQKAGMAPLFEAAKKMVLDGETSYGDMLSMIVSEERERTTKPKK
ncbi:MAG: GspE/PulE family protein [Bacilli bacterium]|nr:GspE/PulE family protein [Bacilli bacterium]